MARIYDEWPGEDYEGSSCRGAMKGWHRHGVCTDNLWPYRDKAGRIRFIKPKEGWQQDAAQRPLGAYYRINKNSITEMQAAIVEVGAIYVSSSVHDGWFLDKTGTLKTIKFSSEEVGGHAYAMVGYTSQGFIIQNSWGPDWGFHGFAILTYQDWVKNGADAWVATLGAPMEIEGREKTFSNKSLRDLAGGKAGWFWQADEKKKYNYRNKAVKPLNESIAYQHTLVLGNNGLPLNRLLEVENASDAVAELVHKLPLQWLKENSKPKIAIYVHGGLNSEEDSLKRIQTMAPYFIANGVYPLFITWRTGFIESIGNILDDFSQQKGAQGESSLARGLWSDLQQQLREAFDRTIESAAETILVKPVWTQMKQNAFSATMENSGLALLTKNISQLNKDITNLEIHLTGHSAGAILVGHMLTLFSKKKIAINSLHLYSPACTVKFAQDYYATFISKGLLAGDKFFCDILSDEMERADSISVYSKSLLYLVSRALEDMHKTPLLGFDGVWNPSSQAEDMFHKSQLTNIDAWRKFASSLNTPRVHGKDRGKVWDGQEYINLAHGSFDNDIEVVTTTLERITGGKLKVKVENLH